MRGESKNKHHTTAKEVGLSLVFSLKSDFFAGSLSAGDVSQRDERLMQTGLGQRRELVGGLDVCVCVCVWRMRDGRCCYENSHKDRVNMIKGLSDTTLQTQLEAGIKKNKK